MRNHATSNLTASRKNRVRRRAARPGLDWVDATLYHCRIIGTLAGLLLHSGEDGLSSELVGDTAALIDREAGQLKKRLREFEKEAR